MKTNDQLGKVVGTSHERLVRVDLHDVTRALVHQSLPVTGGTVTASAVDTDRWRVDLTLAGDQWEPITPRDPLSGLSGHWLAVHVGAVVDTVPELVEVCRVVPVSTRVRRSSEGTTVDVECVGAAGYMAQASSGRYTANRGETCQDMIVRVVRDAAPPGWPGLVDDTTQPVPVPVGFYTDDATPYEVLADLAAVANIAAYFTADWTLVLRDPLPNTPGTPARTLATGVDLIAHDTETGRGYGFANRVEITFDPVGATGRTTIRADWTYRAQGGAPASGEMRATDNGDGTVNLRVHVRDTAGRRRTRALRRVESGDLVELLAPSGARNLYEVQGTTDAGTYLAFDVQLVDTDDGGVQNNDTVELSAYVLAVDSIVGTAQWDTPPLDPASTQGPVVYTESSLGNVTQAQADARAQAMLDVTVRAWQTHLVDAIPDPRLEPDDDVTLVLPNRTLSGRVTRLDLPLTPTDPMTVGLRTFTEELT